MAHSENPSIFIAPGGKQFGALRWCANAIANSWSYGSLDPLPLKLQPNQLNPVMVSINLTTTRGRIMRKRFVEGIY